MHSQIDRELTCDQYCALVLSDSTNYYSHFNPVSSKTSRRAHNTEICGNNFDQDSPSEVTEDFNYDIDMSETTFLEHITTREATNTNSYLFLEK